MINTRPLRPEDQVEIVNIWHSGWHYAHADIVPKGVLDYRTIEYFWSWLSHSTDQFHVAFDDKILGFISTQGPEIVKLYVDRNSRGNGIAATLLSFGERRIRDQGIVDAVLFCTAGNARAQRFYDREGWTLSETFLDRLWLPDHVTSEFIVDTHRYRKRVD